MRTDTACSIDDAIGDSIWIRVQLTGRLDGCIPPSTGGVEGHRTPSHRLPAPAPIVFTAEQPYQMLWSPSWRAGSDAMLPVDVILPPATSLPLYLVGFTIQHPLAASLDRPILLAIQTRRVKIPASQHRTRIPRSPQQSPPGLTDNRQVLTLTTVQTSVRESHQRGGSRPNQPRVQRNEYIIQSFLAAQGRNRHHID